MASATSLLQTPLYDWHAEHGGRLVDFAGWSMPVQYGSIVDEHVATRTRCGLFDVSHMARLSVTGAKAAEWLDGLVTRSVSAMPIGRVRYALVCNEAGGTLDDILVARAEEQRFEVVVNAANHEKLVAWFTDRAAPADAAVLDRTAATAMIAVQGPDAVAMVDDLADADLAPMRYYRCGEATVAGVPCGVSRTGYTGEDGFELVCDANQAAGLWQTLVDRGGQACGLAARDTLRLEAGMPLYGHELTEKINPLHAGLRFAVDFDTKGGEPRPFVGRDALLKARDDGPLAVRVGLKLDSRRPPREEYRVLVDGRPCGVVTSGTHSPTLGCPIAMAYVEPEYASEGSPLAVDVRGTETPAVVTALPFYQRAS